MLNVKGKQTFTHGPHIKMACWYAINHHNIKSLNFGGYHYSHDCQKVNEVWHIIQGKKFEIPQQI